MEKISVENIKKINDALEYIESHLDTDLTLELVSKIALSSPYHFHRLFKKRTNETLNSYINRKRIEKCAGIIFRRKEIPISEIAFKYGFKNTSSFSRSFKKYYGLSPSEFRKISPNKFSNICKLESKNGKVNTTFETYICDIENTKNWIEMHTTIEIKNLPKIDVAYVNNIGIQGLTPAFTKLMQWAGPNGLLAKPDFKLATIYHDSFKVTAPDKVRMSACIFLDNPVKTSGEIGLKSIESGKHIVARCEIGIDEFANAWTQLFVWMNENGYKKSDQDPFEIYHNDFNTHPEKKCIVDLCIPVE